ncbi:chloride channel protein [bacterium]|nr:chloride channel protein [bacterium]
MAKTNRASWIHRRMNLEALRRGRLRLSSAWSWLSHFFLVGIVAGLGAVVFQYFCYLGMYLFMDLLAGYRPPGPAGEAPLFAYTETLFNRWILLFLPAFGGLLSGILVYLAAPEAGGHGTDAAIDAYHNKGGFIRARVPIVKTIASAITITTGGSGGREGPIAQIGAGFGSFLATRLGLTERQRRIMLAAGVGAGVGSIFRAPLAGALFAAEVLYRDPEFESDVIIPAGIASVVAYCVFCLVFGWGSLFHAPDFVFRNPLELGPYTVLAFVVAAAGYLYVKCFYGTKAVFDRLAAPPYLKPALGGLCTGIIGFFLPQTLSFGYGFAQMALNNQLPIFFLLALAMGKILTTSFSIGSGGSGGVFGPSVVIGGALGGAVGQIFHYLMPGVVTSPGAFVVVGIAGFFSGVSNAPISTIIFVSEMTNSYHLLLPSLLVCSLAYLLSRGWTIFHRQAKSRVDSRAHRGEFFVDVLGAIKVRELLARLRKAAPVPEDMTFEDFLPVFQASEQHYFPVMDDTGRLTGIFSINDIRGLLFEADIRTLIRMRDIARQDVIYTTPSEDLNEVLRKFTLRNINSLPVVKDEDRTKLIGMLDRREVIAYYNQRVQEIKARRETPTTAESGQRSDLSLIKVSQAMNPWVRAVSETAGLQELMDLAHSTRYNTFPVTNAENTLIGVVSLSDFQEAMLRGDLAGTVGEIATRSVVTVTGDESLSDAIQKIAAGDFAILPVVSNERDMKLAGVINRRDIMRFVQDGIYVSAQ